MAKYENPAELDYRNGGDTVDDFAQKYMRTVDYIIKALNDLRTPTGNTAGVEPEPYMWRIADNKLYIRNADNTDYVLLGDISPNFGFRQSMNDRFITTADLEREGTVVVRDENNKVTGDITGSPNKIADKPVDVIPTSTNDILAYDATQQAWIKKTLNDYLKKTDDPDYDDLVAEIVDQVITDITPVIFNYWRPDAGGYLTPLGSNVIAPQYGSTQNSVGAVDRPWHEGHFDSVKLNGGDLGEYLAESTGYGIVSGCEPSISGLTVTVGAGVTHLADGTRKEISASSVTLDAADSTNPRIDLVYIDSTGAVAKITGTAATTPSAPSVPTNGISVAQVSVAANATIGTVADMRGMLARWYNAGIVNVKDFGAVGDGVTDDTAAIKSALQKYTGVYLPQGKYCVSETLTLPVGCHIFGDSENTSVLVVKQDIDLFKVNVECIIEKIKIKYDVVNTGNTFEISFNTLTGIDDSEYQDPYKYLGIKIKNIKVSYKCTSYATIGTCFWIKALASDSTTFPSGNGFWGIEVDNVITESQGYGGYGYFCRCYTYANTVSAGGVPTPDAWLGYIVFKNCVTDAARNSFFGAESEADIGDMHYINGDMYIINCTHQCNRSLSFLYAPYQNINMINSNPYDWQYAVEYNGYKRPLLFVNCPLRYQGNPIIIQGWRMLLQDSVQIVNFNFNNDKYNLISRVRKMLMSDAKLTIYDEENQKRINVSPINYSVVDIFHWYKQTIVKQTKNADCYILLSGLIDLSASSYQPIFISLKITDYNDGNSNTAATLTVYSSNLNYVKNNLKIYLHSKEVKVDGTTEYTIYWNFTDTVEPNACIVSWNYSANQDPYDPDESMGKYYNVPIVLSKYSRNTPPANLGTSVDIKGYYRPDYLYSGAAPTTGTWMKGDRVYNGSPSAGGFVGWVCVQGGTPGTWKGFGAIQS